MSGIKLDARLSMVASLVTPSCVVADIGTDHAYLLCYLIEKGITPRGIAADINKGPLENARQTVIDCGFTDRVQLILSDGLQKIPANSADCIVMAGMGGILISEIIEKAAWVKNLNISIVAQPMTHAEVLRRFFCENGFRISEEKTATDGKRYYVAISAVYTGEKITKPESYFYLGELLKNNDDTTREYINKMLFTLEKKFSAQKSAGIEDKENLNDLINEIKLKKTEVYG